MRIALTERFQQDVRDLAAAERSRLLDVLLALPKALGSPHVHAGLGLRKLHATGIWEARLGLGLRIVFTVEPGLLTLVRVGNHDAIQRYLKTL
jgi:mRNA-degrading endonuclease YafQ of YafQ-DinJ toxin-antitoxin module